MVIRIAKWASTSGLEEKTLNEDEIAFVDEDDRTKNMLAIKLASSQKRHTQRRNGPQKTDRKDVR